MNIKSTAIIRESIEELLSYKKSLGSLHKDVKYFLDLIKPHIEIIDDYFKTENADSFQKVIDTNSITLLENICNYLYITIKHSELINEKDRAELSPALTRIKSQSENISLYLRYLE